MWLINQGSKYRVQRLQDLPEEALFPPDDAVNALLKEKKHSWCRVVAVSYRWLTAKHPDPDGVQLAMVRASLIQFLSLLIRLYEAMCDVDIFWDFMSLPQKPRSPADFKLFTFALGGITHVFGSRNSITLQLIGDPDGRHPYSRSGWCRFEEAVSGIVKPEGRLLTLTQLDACDDVKLEKRYDHPSSIPRYSPSLSYMDEWRPGRALLERLPVEIATYLDQTDCILEPLAITKNCLTHQRTHCASQTANAPTRNELPIEIW